MSDERRSDAEIRRDITAEREQLMQALADLRDGIDAKRRPATAAAGALAVGLAAVAALKVARRLAG